MDLGSPLLEHGHGVEARTSRHRCLPCLLTFWWLAGYILLGALERLFFAQMVSGMPSGVLLMHTLLSLMNMSFFIVMQLARSQGVGDGQPLSDVLQRLNGFDVLSMAVLDTVHSLLALEGATAISGITQSLILQGVVPATALLAVLLPPPSASHPLRASSPSSLRSLRLRLMHMINHLTPGECVGHVATSHVTYTALGGALIFSAVVAAVQCDSLPLAPSVPPLVGAMVRRSMVNVTATSSTALLPSSNFLSASMGRILFALSTPVAALASVQKRRCLMRQPTDQLLLNTCLSVLQLFVGLFLAPPMLLVLRRQPIRDTLVQLARGLRCCMSGFNSLVCADASDAFGTPALLTYFIVSSAWSASSYGLLRVGGHAPFAIGSALVMPTTILAFVRPVPLPYSWAAAPLKLTQSDSIITVWLSFSLLIFHSASVSGTLGADHSPWHLSSGGSPTASSGSVSSSGDTHSARDMHPSELVGASLHL